MKLIRSLAFPWFMFFIFAIGAIIIVGVKYPHLEAKAQQSYIPFLVMGAVLCIFANLRSLDGVGIWMSESLPESLRYGSWSWIFRAVKVGVIAAAFWFVGQMPWVPLIWQAAVIPTVFTICLFVAVCSLLGPILKLSSNLAWRRATSVILSLPILAAVPVTALFIGQSFVTAYRASHPEVAILAAQSAANAELLAKEEAANPKKSGKKKDKDKQKEAAAVLAAQKKPAEPKPEPLLSDEELATAIRSGPNNKRAAAFKQIAEKGGSCTEYTKDVIAALDPKGPKEVVYWAVKAAPCAEVRSVVGMPKLVNIMLEHTDPPTRAAAIRGLTKYGSENVRQISYLLVKRISDREPPEVIEATAAVMAPLGPGQQRYSTSRLKSLLGSKDSGPVAAKALIETFGRDDLVAEFVAQNLNGPEEVRKRAVDMVCLLPKEKRVIAEPHISGIVGQIKTADKDDPGVKALNCLGQAGFNAIREEVKNPRQLSRPVAARALTEMNVKDSPEAIETADTCSRDNNEQVRKWCSQSLGQIGAPAVPKIMELLKSSDEHLKDAGKNALEFFSDVSAKDELQRIRRENSGWMADNKKLQIAKALDTALVKLEAPKPVPAPSPQANSNGGLRGTDGGSEAKSVRDR